MIWLLLGLAVPAGHLVISHRPGSVHVRRHRAAPLARRLAVDGAWLAYLAGIMLAVFLA